MMESRMNEFKKFVSLHPLLRDEVKNGKRTWQNIYEEWVLYGESETIWGKYVIVDNKGDDTISNRESKSMSFSNILNNEGIKNTLDYIKKIDPNKINNTLNNMQKVIQIIQTFTGNKGVTIPSSTNAFSDWWD